jgi:hypothetical protein
LCSRKVVNKKSPIIIEEEKEETPNQPDKNKTPIKQFVSPTRTTSII